MHELPNYNESISNSNVTDDKDEFSELFLILKYDTNTNCIPQTSFQTSFLDIPLSMEVTTENNIIDS